MVAYLASSAFGHLYRKLDCAAADIGALRKAIYSRTVSIPLGLHNLEEIVLARQASPQAMAAQLRLLLSISNWRVLLKPCGQLLGDDLRAFAASSDPARPSLHGAMQNAVTTGISELLERTSRRRSTRRDASGKHSSRGLASFSPNAARASRRRPPRTPSTSISSATRRRWRRRSPTAPASVRNSGAEAPKRCSR
jgi:hypothetical protein